MEAEEPLSAKRWVRSTLEENLKCLSSGIDSLVAQRDMKSGSQTEAGEY